MTARLSAHSLFVVTPQVPNHRVGTSLCRCIDYGYANDALMQRYTVSAAVSWDGLPSDHACLVLGLVGRGRCEPVPPAAVAPVVSQCRLGRAVWGKAPLRVRAMDLLLPLL